MSATGGPIVASISGRLADLLEPSIVTVTDRFAEPLMCVFLLPRRLLPLIECLSRTLALVTNLWRTVIRRNLRDRSKIWCAPLPQVVVHAQGPVPCGGLSPGAQPR